MVTLSLLLKAGHTVEIIRRLAPQFEAQHGISLNIEVASENEAYGRLVSGKDLPDVCTVPYWYVAEMVEAGSLSPLIAKNFPGESHPTATAALTYKNQLWGIPHTLTGGTCYRRNDSIPLSTESPNATFEDFLVTWDSLIESGQSLAIRASADFSSAETYRGLAHAAGLDLFADDVASNFESFEKGLWPILSRLRQQPARLTSLGYVAMGDLLPSGSATMMFDTSAWATIYGQDENLEGSLSLGPIGGANSAQFLYAEGLGISSSCANQDAANALIAWRQSDTVLKEEVTSLNRIDFPRLDLQQKEWFKEQVGWGFNSRVFAEVLRSWGQIAPNYPVRGSGFVVWGRRLMEGVRNTIDGPSMSSSQAFDQHFTPKHSPLPPPPGKSSWKLRQR